MGKITAGGKPVVDNSENRCIARRTPKWLSTPKSVHSPFYITNGFPKAVMTTPGPEQKDRKPQNEQQEGGESS